jgi:hypothetical protein
MFERPWLIGGVGIAYGYLKAAATRHPRYEDPDYLRYLRRFELSTLVLGRRRTLAFMNRRVRERAQRRS